MIESQRLLKLYRVLKRLNFLQTGHSACCTHYHGPRLFQKSQAPVDSVFNEWMNTSQCDDSEEQAVGPDRNFVGLPGSGGAAPLPRPDEEYAALLNERKRAQNAR